MLILYLLLLFSLSAVVRDTEGVQPAETDGHLGPPYATPDQILPPTQSNTSSHGGC